MEQKNIKKSEECIETQEVYNGNLRVQGGAMEELAKEHSSQYEGKKEGCINME